MFNFLQVKRPNVKPSIFRDSIDTTAEWQENTEKSSVYLTVEFA